MNYLLTVALHAAILSVLCALALACLRRPQHRAPAALCALIALAILPWISASHPLPLPSAAPVVEAAGPAAVPMVRAFALIEQTPEPAPVATYANPPQDASVHLPRWQELALGIWLAGTFAWIVRLIRQASILHRWLAGLKPVTIDEESLLSGYPCLVGSPGTPPCAAGMLRPRIVIGSDLISRPRELRWTLRHELAHLRAHDTRITGFTSLLRAFLWWNPFVHHLVRSWSHAREQLCDLAAADPGERADYSEFLLRIAAPGRLPTLALARHPLHQRITSLMKAPAKAPQPARALPPVAALLLVVVSSVLSLFHLQAEETGPGAGNTATAGHQEGPKAAEAPVDVPPELAPPLIKLEVRFTFAPKPMAEMACFLTEKEVMDDMRKLSRIKGVGLMTLPTTAFRANQPATIQAIRERPNSGDGPCIAGDGTILRPFTGYIVQTEALINSEAELILKSRITFSHTRGIPSDLLDKPEGVDWDNLKSWQSVCSGTFSEPGRTLRVYMGEVARGQHLEAYLKATPIDENGRPLKDYSLRPVKQAKPTVLSRATLRATLVDLPLSAEDRKEENLRSSTYASPREEFPPLMSRKLRKWKADAGVTVTELEPVQLSKTDQLDSFPPAPAPKGPWKEIPDVVPSLIGPSRPGESADLLCTAPAIPPYETGEIVPWHTYGCENRDWVLKLPSPDPDRRRLLVLTLSGIETGPFNDE